MPGDSLCLYERWGSSNRDGWVVHHIEGAGRKWRGEFENAVREGSQNDPVDGIFFIRRAHMGEPERVHQDNAFRASQPATFNFDPSTNEPAAPAKTDQVARRPAAARRRK